MTNVDMVATTSPVDCCSCSAGSSDAGEGCSFWKLFSLCRRRHRAGSQSSLIKSGLASTSSSVGTSKRTLTSHDGVLGDTDPAPSSDLEVDVRPPPSYLRVSHSVGGYSTFTSYAPPPAVEIQQPATTAVVVDGDTRTVRNTPPKGGQQCRVTLVDHVIADVRTLSNGDADVINDVDPHHNGSDVTDDAVDGPVPGGRTSSTDIKDGAYFLALVDSEQNRLQQHCCQIERHLEEPDGTIPEEVQGKMRSAIGKANLLTTKKFRQFRQLCSKNLSKKEDEERFQTTDADLAGFWDMVLLQVADVDRMFAELDELRRHDWNVDNVHKPKSSADVSPRSFSGSKDRATPRTGRPSQNLPAVKTTRSELSSRSRQEARQRLSAARLAGRQRKTSDSDKDVQIFVS